MKVASKILAVLGILLAAYALVGRFVGGTQVLSSLVPGGIAAGTMMAGANTLLVLAVLVCCCSKNCNGSSDEVKKG